MRNHAGRATLLVTLALALACDSSTPVLVEKSLLTRADNVSLANTRRDVVQFDLHVSADFFLTCINEMTHWEGPVHVTASTVATPGGPVISQFRNDVSPDFFIERADGTRYFATPSAGQTATIIEAGVSVTSVTSQGTFKSASGDVLPTTVHFQVVMRGDDVVVEKFVGACP